MNLVLRVGYIHNVWTNTTNIAPREFFAAPCYAKILVY